MQRKLVPACCVSGRKTYIS